MSTQQPKRPEPPAGLTKKWLFRFMVAMFIAGILAYLGILMLLFL